MSAPANGPTPRVWLITGCSGGLGVLFALEALKRGDKVIATSRQAKAESLEPLKEAGATILELDVTSSFDRIKELAAEAEGMYGGVDVVVNNSGFPAVGPLEELGADGMRIQFETNLFGLVNVTNAFLPYMRERREGTIVIIGSRSGWRTLPGTGAYSASKAAVHGAYGDALAAEVEPFGIRVVTMIPGGFPTHGLNGRPTLSNPAVSYPTFNHIDDYAPFRKVFEEYTQKLAGSQPNQPQAFAELVIDVVRGEGLMRNADGGLKPWPTRLVVGSDSQRDIGLKIAEIEETMADYPEFITRTDRTNLHQDSAPRN